MKGRDKRRRATDRKNQGAVSVAMKPRRCIALNALIDDATCRAEQRIQRCQPENGCKGCEHYVSQV